MRRRGEAAFLPPAPATAWRSKLTGLLALETRTSSRRSLLGADHVFAQRFFSRFARRHHDRELSPIHHGNSIGEREHFIQLGAYEKNRLALRARIEQLLVDELDGADVYPACGLRGKQDREVASHLSGDDDLLLVTTRQSSGGKNGVRRPDVEGGDFLPCVRQNLILVDDAAL